MFAAEDEDDSDDSDDLGQLGRGQGQCEGHIGVKPTTSLFRSPVSLDLSLTSSLSSTDDDDLGRRRSRPLAAMNEDRKLERDRHVMSDGAREHDAAGLREKVLAYILTRPLAHCWGLGLHLPSCQTQKDTLLVCRGRRSNLERCRGFIRQSPELRPTRPSNPLVYV